MLMLLEKRTILERVLRESTGLEDVLLAEGGEHADLATTVAFALAKQKKQAPDKIAQDLMAELSKKQPAWYLNTRAPTPTVPFM